jgi:aconitase B
MEFIKAGGSYAIVFGKSKLCFENFSIDIVPVFAQKKFPKDKDLQQ